MGTYSYIIPSEFRQKNILYTTLFSGANNDVFNNELGKTISYITRQDTAHIGITYINGLSPSDQTLLNTFMDGYTWVAFEKISNIGQTGEQGIQGMTGQNGTAGPPGGAGSPGGAGPSGAAGLLGATGTSGVQGAIGSTGQQGIQGIIGTTGLLGATGTSGVQGAMGSTGQQGIQGIIGATGIQGATGVGTSGPPGIPGATGVAGSNAELYNSSILASVTRSIKTDDKSNEFNIFTELFDNSHYNINSLSDIDFDDSNGVFTINTTGFYQINANMVIGGAGGNVIIRIYINDILEYESSAIDVEGSTYNPDLLSISIIKEIPDGNNVCVKVSTTGTIFIGIGTTVNIHGLIGPVGPTGETGNPFNQDLNTTDNVSFNNLNVSSITSNSVSSTSVSSTSVSSTSVLTNSVQTISLQASSVLAGSLTIGSVPNNFIINQGRGNTGEYLQTDGVGGTSWQPFPTKPYGSQTFNDNDDETKIETEGVFVSVAGARNIPPLLPLSLLRDFTSTTTGLQYTGAVTKIFNVNSSISWALDNGKEKECQVAIFLNDDIVPGTKQIGKLDDEGKDHPRNVFVTAIISLEEDDIVDIKVTNASSTDGIIVSNFSFCISYIDDL
jgi:hypothetical protein